MRPKRFRDIDPQMSQTNRWIWTAISSVVCGLCAFYVAPAFFHPNTVVVLVCGSFCWLCGTIGTGLDYRRITNEEASKCAQNHL